MRRIFYCNYYSKQPEVKALLDFSEHIQTLSELENRDSSEIEMEDTPAQSFCDDLMEQIRNKVKSDVNLTVNASNMSAKISYLIQVLASPKRSVRISSSHSLRSATSPLATASDSPSANRWP